MNLPDKASISSVHLSSTFKGKARSLIPIFKDPQVTDLFINGLKSVYVEKAGTLIELPNPFWTQNDLSAFVESLLLPLGKRVDALHPYVDGHLGDGTRFHIVFPPAAVGGACLSFRKLKSCGSLPLSLFIDEKWLAWIRREINMRKNLLICGATGSGKTTFLARCLELIPQTQRLILIEEVIEIPCAHPHVIRLEARPNDPEGRGEITLAQLLKESLRMRPDRVILGECRGKEAFEVIQALNTGHTGGITTIHANSAHDALFRLEGLLLSSSSNITVEVARKWIAQSLSHILFLKRVGENRKVAEIISLMGVEAGQYRIEPRFESP